jgi:hypothetical protein
MSSRRKNDAEHSNATLSRHPIFRSTGVVLVKARAAQMSGQGAMRSMTPALKANANLASGDKDGTNLSQVKAMLNRQISKPIRKTGPQSKSDKN